MPITAIAFPGSLVGTKAEVQAMTPLARRDAVIALGHQRNALVTAALVTSWQILIVYDETKHYFGIARGLSAATAAASGGVPIP